jgi:CRISPR-associated protein Cmr5
MPEVTQRQTLEQGRAKHAYDRAANASQQGFKKEYKSWAKKVPMLIKSNGLGATLAFLKSNNKKPHHNAILNDIQSWIEKDVKFSSIYHSLKGDDLVARVINCDSLYYRAFTIEILAYLNWLKRFSDGLIND